MKSFLFVCALVVSQVASAEIIIKSFEGIGGINLNGSDYEVVLDKNSQVDLKVTFYSTKKIGMPLITRTDVVEKIIEATQTVHPLLAVNQIVTIRTSVYRMETEEIPSVYKIGVDGNNDGKLDSADDDYISITFSEKWIL